MLTVNLIISDLNRVIMEYLIREGYPAAAEKFAAEANMPNMWDYSAIRARVSIREDISAGKIQTAIEKINELAPQVSLPFPAIFRRKDSHITTGKAAMIKFMFMHHS